MFFQKQMQRSSDRKFDLKKYCIANTRLRKERSTVGHGIPNLKDSLSTMSKSNIYGTEGIDQNKQSLKKTMAKAMHIYFCNLEFYQTNGHKLQNVIFGELREKNYLERNKIMEFFKNRGEVSFGNKTNIQVFEEELKVFCDFLFENYQRRKMKEISIICHNIKEEQKIINQKTNIYEYDEIYNQLELKNSKSRNFDFISQYQHICTNYGIPDNNIRPHLKIKNHLESSKEDVVNLFQTARVEKEMRKFIIKKKLMTKFCP